MNKPLFALTVAVAVASAASAIECTVSADRMAADRLTGSLVATGHVAVVSKPYRMLSEQVTRSVDSGVQTFSFADRTLVTTCTNDIDHLHWFATGSVTYRNILDRGAQPDAGPDEFTGRDLTLKLFGIPVAWVPYVWIPRNTDYGWRVMPGYASRWGAYVLTKYVYPIAGDMGEGRWGLEGNTRFDLRSENGIALGQGVGWSLGDFGRGKFKAYYAWDQDADRYDRNWTRRKWHYANWGSEVPDERYGLTLEHRWEATERDVVRLRGAYYSDSHFRRDFLRSTQFGLDNPYPGADRNELAWEHNGAWYAAGASVAGQLNDFYGATSRLPEFYLEVMPQPVFGLPVNYESQSRVGWLNREYAKHGRAGSTALPYRYDPGRWADYQAMRADTYHRLSAPFKAADVLSVVPRVGVRATWWSDSGRTSIDGTSRAGSTDDDVTRAIVEGGVTFAARGTAPIGEDWLHVIEPYADVLAQEASYSGLSRHGRPYFFDSVDGSADWLDQFAGRSRNLPYSWYGITPGLRNAFRTTDDVTGYRTVFDLDVYAAVQLNDTSWTEGGRYHRLSSDPEKPNYGRDGEATVVPGMRARWFVNRDSAVLARAEWDGENDTLAYADVAWKHRVSQTFRYEVSYSARDQRWWDFASTPFDAALMRNEDFNRARFEYGQVRFEYEPCDAIVLAPFARWDLRENELDEIGGWIDFRTDCLGFRFSVSYENDYRRIDDSEHRDNIRCSFGIYLRAFGPKLGTMFGD